jgi:hypothetical protein
VKTRNEEAIINLRHLQLDRRITSITHRTALLGASVLALICLFPCPALALQPHEAPEGLYVHQIAHLLFIGALLFFIYKLRPEAQQHRSFRVIVWACGLFALWNLDTFVAHWCAVPISPQDFLGPEGYFSQRLLMSGLPHWVYYFTKLDHLILVPAFYFFYRGLKSLAKEPQAE